MKVQNKPDYLVFASDAQAGELEPFPNIARGWGITIEQTESKPPMEWMNDAFNRIDKNTLYLLQQGVPEWDSAVVYPVDAVIKYQSELYIAIIENENAIPLSHFEKWKKVIPEVKEASITQQGIVQLSSAIDSESEQTAATSKAVKILNDRVSPIYSNASISVDNNKIGAFNLFSPSHRYMLAVKNDGWSGVWDCELSKWQYAFDPNGYLAVGTIPTLGVNQSWQDVTLQRNNNVIYTNTSGKPIIVSIVSPWGDGVNVIDIYTQGVNVARLSEANSWNHVNTVNAIIPVGATYTVVWTKRAPAIWAELR
ncbi:phage tail protein [Orbus sturtevantii]|uniref:phage tail protein n=1 Tax=Orbus sturtevantii TaxID=3074109 RepID=UPI00370D17C1